MGSDSTLAERLDEVFGAALRERRVVGAVAIVARDGQVKYRRAHGLADREGSVPMREDTLFRLASVTKPIVTMAVLRLVGDELIADQKQIPAAAPLATFENAVYTKGLPDAIGR
ncbi:Beta-lactamase/esterase [Mycobacteroides abscessus]|nr:Beta-lactamase/esterase [Mycobacteroides abscessus]